MATGFFSSSPPRTSSPPRIGSESAQPLPSSSVPVAARLGPIPSGDDGNTDILGQESHGQRALESRRRQVVVPSAGAPSSSVAPSESMDMDTGGTGDLIWGTNVNTDDLQRQVMHFLTSFEKDGEKLYPGLIEDAIDGDLTTINIDMANVFEFDPELYAQTINFPAEVLPSYDAQVMAFAQTHFGDRPEVSSDMVDIWTHPFNLKETKSMRTLNPSDIDKLVAVTGMVIRATNVIPDIQSAYFRCSLCSKEVESIIDNGRIEEPVTCPNQSCQGSKTMELVHNRCKFQDKQLVKVQETPENIPDGETPQTIDIYVYESLVDTTRPGDRVEITGVYRAVPVRRNPRHRSINAVYRSYIDCVHIEKRKSNGQALVGLEDDDGDLAMDGMDENEFKESIHFEADESEAKRLERIRKIKALAREPGIYEKLVKSLAPSIWEMEDVKKGILCQLLGCSHKNFGDESQPGGGGGRHGSRHKFRSQMNILLCGDPGTSKSQLLQYVHKIAPRGIYTSGKGSSAVGLTAYISKDSETGDLVLESGALVLSDKGICCIDEFDKMSESARSILHEVMEQQTVSIAKAGIICTLNARTSILAAANPIESRYNPTKSVIENIDLPPTLMSRFDLIYLVLDRPNENLDRTLANHLVAMYFEDSERDRLDRYATGELIDLQTLTDFISYTRRAIHPKLSDEAGQALIDGYVDMRSIGRLSGRKVITATPRQLESLIRISEALARVTHSEFVRREHVQEAIRLHKVATLAAATDPRTGAIDLNSINVGRSTEDERILMERAGMVLEILRKHSGRTISMKSLLKKYNRTIERRNAGSGSGMAGAGMDGGGPMDEGITESDLKGIVDRLEQSGKVRGGDWLKDSANIVITILDTTALM